MKAGTARVGDSIYFKTSNSRYSCKITRIEVDNAITGRKLWGFWQTDSEPQDFRESFSYESEVTLESVRWKERI